jgi:hypothetical protein
VPVWNDTLLPEDKYGSIAGSINSSASPEQRRLLEAVRKGTPPRSSSSPSRKSSKAQSGSANIILDSLPQSSASSGQPPEPPLSSTRIVRPSQRDLPAPKSPKRRFKPVQRSKLRQVEGPADPTVSDPPVSPARTRNRPAEDNKSQGKRGEGSRNAVDSEHGATAGAEAGPERLPPLPKKCPRRNPAAISTPFEEEAGALQGPASSLDRASLDHSVEGTSHSDHGSSSEEQEIGVSLAEAFIMKWVLFFFLVHRLLPADRPVQVLGAI